MPGLPVSSQAVVGESFLGAAIKSLERSQVSDFFEKVSRRGRT